MADENQNGGRAFKLPRGTGRQFPTAPMEKPPVRMRAGEWGGTFAILSPLCPGFIFHLDFDQASRVSLLICAISRTKSTG